MVVIDISDLENICYSIIGFSICHAQRVFGSAKQPSFLPFISQFIIEDYPLFELSRNCKTL